MATAPAYKRSALKGKGGLVALGILAVLGIWLIADLKKPPRDPDSLAPVSEYVHADSGEVTRVEVKREKNPFVLVREGDKWRFESPGQFPANEENVKTWLEGLLEKATVTQETHTKPGADKLASYGLDKPAAEIVLTKRGGETRTLQLGKEYPGVSSAGHYAREAKDGRLFLVSSTQAGDVKDKKTDDLRDKRLLDLKETKDVTKVVLQRPAGTVELVRQSEEKWDMLQPFRAPADRDTVENTLLTNVKSAQADSFVESSGADLAKYGLDQPRLSVQITSRSGQHGLVFGKAAKDGKVYAARAGSKEVLLVPKTTFDDVDKKAGDLRDRKLTSLEREKITSIEIQNPHGTIKLKKVGADQWEFADATDPKQRRAKGDRIQTILGDLTNSARKYVEETPKDLARYGLEKPPISVIASDGQGTSQVVQVGKKSKGGYYVKGASGPVFEVDAFIYDDLNLKRDAFKEEEPKK